VLRADSHATEEELRRFAAARLADFKVPTRVVFVDEVPKGPTGKLQRVGLADTLGITAASTTLEDATVFVAPRTPAEETLAQIWASVLGLERVGVCHSFLVLGGDSMLATRVVARVCETFQVAVTLQDFFEAPTVESMALIVEEKLLKEMEALTDDEAQHLLGGK
jgi:acyl carrier protein